MGTKGSILSAAAALGIGVAAMAGASDAMVVSIHYSIRDNDPERLIKKVVNPLERSMQKLDRIVQINSSATHWVVEVELGFQGNATAQDLATVTAQLDALRLEQDVPVISRTIELRPARMLLE